MYLFYFLCDKIVASLTGDGILDSVKCTSVWEAVFIDNPGAFHQHCKHPSQESTLQGQFLHIRKILSEARKAESSSIHLTLAESLLISTESVRKWVMLKVCELGAQHIFQAPLPIYEQCMRVWHRTCNPIKSWIPWNCYGFCCVVWPSERLRIQSGASPEPPRTGFMFFAKQSLFGGWMDSEIVFMVNP